MDKELEAFKTLPINFAAAALGYQLVKSKSSRHSAVMTNGDHKIVCSTSRHDGHGVFFSTDGRASGSLIDLAQHIGGAGTTLGHVRKMLRPLLQPGGLPIEAEQCGGQLKPTTTDFLSVLARFSNFEPITTPHAYLCDRRQIPADVLLHDRFTGRIFRDDRGNATFPHYGSPDGSRDRCLTGYVIKGDGVTMFSKGGKKGLWPSNACDSDTKLVIAEAAIDALSYGVLHCDLATTRFISTGGQLNPEQPMLLQSAISNLPAGEVVLAMDNDDGGDQLTQKLTSIFSGTNRDNLELRSHVPPSRGGDWNAVLTSPTHE